MKDGRRTTGGRLCGVLDVVAHILGAGVRSENVFVVAALDISPTFVRETALGSRVRRRPPSKPFADAA